MQPQITHTDSTKIEYIYKDTLIYIPAKKIIIKDTIPCPIIDYSKEKQDSTTKVTAKIILKNGKLHVECMVDSLQQRIKWLEKQQETIKKTILTNTVTINKPVPYTPHWHWYLHGVLLLLLMWLFRTPVISNIKHLFSKWN